jgi:hypothetical protein
MHSLLRVAFVALLLPLGVVPASAFCARGDNSIPGSIGPGQTDGTRSYTINGRAILTVAGAVDVSGNPVSLIVTFPGFCQSRSGPTVSCTVSTYGVVNVVITNPTGRQATYTWVCTSLR